MKTRLLEGDFGSEFKTPSGIAERSFEPESKAPIQAPFLPKNPWYRPGRLAWLGTFFASLFIIPISIGKATLQLLSGQPLSALKTLVFGTLTSVAMSTLSLFSALISPRIGKWVFQKCILPGKYDPNEDFTPDQQAKDGFVFVTFPNHFVTTESLPTPKGIVERVKIRPKTPSDQYTILFSGNGGYHQAHLQELIDSKNEITQHLQPAPQGLRAQERNIIGLNYPGKNSQPRGKYNPSSAKDLVNAGIAQVNETIQELKNKKGWSNEDVRRELKNHLFLQGHSLGGGVALQVAAHFKVTCQIDIPVLVDRSFSSLKDVIAQSANRLTSIPTWFGKPYASLLLYAGGGWEMDSVEACKKLNPDMVTICNLELPPPTKPKSFLEGWSELLLGPSPRSDKKLTRWQRFKNFFYRNAHDADPVILNGATLADGVDRAAKEEQSKIHEEKSKKPSHSPEQKHSSSSGKIMHGLSILSRKRNRYESNPRYREDRHNCAMERLIYEEKGEIKTEFNAQHDFEKLLPISSASSPETAEAPAIVIAGLPPLERKRDTPLPTEPYVARHRASQQQVIAGLPPLKKERGIRLPTEDYVAHHTASLHHPPLP